ncbi:MAG: zf-HC2 domain-containing protein [Micromonosporaceae bacterium]
MKCEQARAAVSAGLDGEDPPVAAAAATQHLTGCVECRSWKARAETVTRLVRVQPALAAPDLAERVLVAAAADRGRHGAEQAEGGWVRRWLRWAVALVALAQISLAVPELLAGHQHGVHLGREGASFDIAFAVGFLLAARYPERARALAPVAMVLAMFLMVTSGVDLLAQSTTWLHEIAHGLTLLQAGLLWALVRAWGSGLRARPLPT